MTDSLIGKLEATIAKVKNKKILSRLIAERFDKAPKSVYNNWICGYGYYIPERYQQEVLEFIDNYLKTEQNGEK